MPIYEFECPVHGKFETFRSVSKASEKTVICGEVRLGFQNVKNPCKEVAERIWSQLGLVSGMSQALPTTIFRNPRTGEIRTAVLRNQETPAGYIREDLKTPMERTKVEKEMQQRADAENEYVTERNRYLKEETQKARQADLKSKMGSIVKDSDNPTAAASLLTAAMKRNRKKKLPPKKTEFHFAVNHNNKSNLDKG